MGFAVCNAALAAGAFIFLMLATLGNTTAGTVRTYDQRM